MLVVEVPWVSRYGGVLAAHKKKNGRGWVAGRRRREANMWLGGRAGIYFCSPFSLKNGFCTLPTVPPALQAHPVCHNQH